MPVNFPQATSITYVCRGRLGTDIGGAIECRRVFRYPPQSASGKAWEFAIDLSQLYDTRDYDSFGCRSGS